MHHASYHFADRPESASNAVPTRRSPRRTRSRMWFFITSLILCSLHGPNVFAQRGVPRDFWRNKLFFDEINKMNEQQRRSVQNECQEIVRQSEAQIEEFTSQGTKLQQDLQSAERACRVCDKAVQACESETRRTRKQLAERKNQLPAEQSDQSEYRSRLNRLREAELDSIAQAQRILKHAVKDGNPDKLKSSLRKSEYQLLENDLDCSAAFRTYRLAKDQLSEEINRLIDADPTVKKLESQLRSQLEDEQKQRSELANAKKTVSALQKKCNAINTRLAEVNDKRDAVLGILASVRR